MSHQHHYFVTGAILSLLVIIVYLHHEEIRSGLGSMINPPTISPTPLKVIISPSTSASSVLGSVTIHIAIENLSSYPISILRWSTPLDRHAAAIGVFTFISTTTNTLAPCLDMKFNNQLPTKGYFAFDDEDIIHIPANGNIELDVEFKEPEVALTKEDKYGVKTQGTWAGVWIHENGEESPRNLYLDDADLKRGDFESNEIIVDISREAGMDL